MASVNKVTILGNLGRDPETRYTPNGSAVASFSVATSRKWKNRDTGEPQEETEWHRLVAYERLAEIVGEYLKKGSSVYIEGRLKTRKWQDKEGVDRYTTEIIVESLQMLGGRRDDEGDAAPAPAPAQQRSAPPQRQASRPATGTGFDAMDDDIPF